MALDPSSPMTDELRSKLITAIPSPPLLLPPPIERDRWREVLVEEVNRLASARYPQESVELLVNSSAAYWSEWMPVLGQEDGITRWSIRAPMSRRLLPRAGFAHMFVEGAPPGQGGARLDVPAGHRIKQLFTSWMDACAVRTTAEAHVSAQFATLLNAATTLGDVLDAWPGAADTLVGLTPSATPLAAAQDAVRAILGAAPTPTPTTTEEAT